METNFSTNFDPELELSYNLEASEINLNLPFALKAEYDNKCISQILELEEEYLSIKKFWNKNELLQGIHVDQKEMIYFIIDRINRRGVFPTSSDIKKILNAEEEYLEMERDSNPVRLAG
jgi:hypothetical protein